MEKMVEKVYLEFDTKRKKQEAQQADNEDLHELKVLEEEIKREKIILNAISKKYYSMR